MSITLPNIIFGAGITLLTAVAVLVIWFFAFTLPHAAKNTWTEILNKFDEPIDWRWFLSWIFLPIAFFQNMGSAIQCFFDRGLTVRVIRNQK